MPGSTQPTALLGDLQTMTSTLTITTSTCTTSSPDAVSHHCPAPVEEQADPRTIHQNLSSSPDLPIHMFHPGTPAPHKSPRPHRNCKVLQPLLPPETPPVPYEVIITDVARLHTYVGHSKLIPGERGLFAGRQFQPGDKVGEYYGGEHLSRETVYSANHKSKYAVDIKGIIRDCWCPRTQQVLCMTGYINDLLDEAKENCHWVKRGNRIFVYVNADKTIRQHEEFSISYGNEYWADQSYPLDLLRRAAQSYAQDIDHRQGSPWRKLPQYNLIFPDRALPPAVTTKRSYPFSPTTHSSKKIRPTPTQPESTQIAADTDHLYTHTIPVSTLPHPSPNSGHKRPRAQCSPRPATQRKRRLEKSAEGTPHISNFFYTVHRSTSPASPPQSPTEPPEVPFDKRCADS